MNRKTPRRCGARRVLLVLAAATLTACSGEPAGDDTPSVERFTEVTTSPLSPSYAPELLGVAGGHFENQNLEVELVEARGAQAIQLLIAGQADIARLDSIETMNAISTTGAELVAVATRAPQTFSRFISSADDPIRTPEDFAGGRTIGVPSRGGVTEQSLDLLLDLAGVDRESVERQVVGLNPGVFDLIKQGSLDGSAATLSGAAVLAANNTDVVVLNPSDFLSAGSTHYVVTRETFEQRRDVVRRFLQGMYDAQEAIIVSPGIDESLAVINEHFDIESLENTERAKSEIELYIDAWTLGGQGNSMMIDGEQWQRGYDELVEAGFVKPGLNPADWYSNDLVPN